MNVLLSTIGESPVNTLGTVDQPQEAVTAREVLNEVSKDVQSEGWNFNLMRHFKLVPDTDGLITVPNNCVHVKPVDPNPFIRVALRGLKLWNVDKNSYVFQNPIWADMLLLLDFDQLPQQAKKYITAKASRLFQQRFVGSQVLDTYTKEEEYRSRAELLQYDIREGKPSMLHDSHMLRGMMYR